MRLKEALILREEAKKPLGMIYCLPPPGLPHKRILPNSQWRPWSWVDPSLFLAISIYGHGVMVTQGTKICSLFVSFLIKTRSRENCFRVFWGVRSTFFMELIWAPERNPNPTHELLVTTNKTFKPEGENASLQLLGDCLESDPIIGSLQVAWRED